MAFTTTTGENGTDYIGSEGVDALFVLNDNSGKIFVDAKGGNDVVDLTNETGVVGNAEVKLGEGGDTLTMGGNDTNNNRLSGSTVNGGPGNDNITTEGALSTKLRGNENDDDFFLTSNYTDTTINGNSGVDSFTIGTSTTNRGGAITLSDTKILGGADNDGQMDFSDGTILGVDSVIQGGKGLDTITIGALTTGLSNFRVSGGADNDTITVNNTNGAADGAAYNGAGGDDAITFVAQTGNDGDDGTDPATTVAGNAGDATTKGGDGNDRFTINGTGKIAALGEAGDDTFVIDTIFDANTNDAVPNGTGGKHTITGGAGADVYTTSNTVAAGDDRTGVTYVISSVADSAATTSGTTAGFDQFTVAIDNTLDAGNGFAGYDDIIDMRGGAGEQLVGNRLNSDEVNNSGVVQDGGVDIVGASYASFAALATALAGNLDASVSNLNNTNTGRISLEMVEIDAPAAGATGIEGGYYAILNNTNTILDSGDMMIRMAAANTGDAAGEDTAAAAELAQIAAAIEAGFAL